jgi:UDP-glucose 4-epimerase
MAVFLVTGGAGFIGSHLAEVLVKEGHEVRVLDQAASSLLAGLGLPRERLQIIPGDLADLDLVRQCAQGVETVFHLGVPREWSNPLTSVLTEHAATTGTMHTLIAAREAGVRRVVYASCGSVYGVAASQPVNEECPLAPVSDFARAKETSEKDCYAFTYLYGLETVRLRLFNVYGPRQEDSGPHGRFLLQALKSAAAGGIPEIPGDGRSAIDALHVGDAVYAFLLAARTSRASGKVFNIGYGKTVTSLKVLDAINRVLGTAIQPNYSAAQPRTEFDNLPDVKRAETELGFCPAIDLETGCRQTITAYFEMSAPALDLGDAQEKKPLPSREKTQNP